MKMRSERIARSLLRVSELQLSSIFITTRKTAQRRKRNSKEK
jgi:hypothetical protein